MNNSYKNIIVGLLHLKGVGRHKVKHLLEMIQDPQSLSLLEIVAIGQTFQIISNQIKQDEIRAAVDFANVLIYDCEQKKINYITYLDKDFPESMNFNDGPILLFYQGDLNSLNSPKRAAVIGSRQPSPTGLDFAYNAAKTLAENDFVVISGLAVGCDTQAHLGCLSGGGKTVAFLPSGLSPVYPHANQFLAEKILSQNGCLMTEYNHQEKVQPYKFIERDRIQSATCHFVIVSNFSPLGGTIHTLEYCQKYRKTIYASPSIYKESKNGFEMLNKKNITYHILDNSALKKLIENFKENY
ncbi:DNA-processing protein DprA [Acetobacterium woodii]|uniref:DNA recombination-mediator protein A n=1 Tax=Acetobacterium woodii (strain ATCC 29683 / DSM 1030 / JCM 2381 / KCTC 1655 / WB1) TaxID=931626 RepID=H6LK08_ACEWD|nr:DNA-processing protein DprA [Acetobacterium woodii]AFA48762.1 DNA recombination-mediator protein A [Acetobacterium woodii DSM 1030]